MIEGLVGAEAAATDLDEFRLIRVLGHGGMGTVYLAHDTLLEREVAIKVVRVDAVDERLRHRFLVEARAVARLSHPNVVTVFRAGLTPTGQPYLAQELIRGHSLAAAPRPVPPDEALRLALDVARGLAAAHRAGILHRDVKPANVMVSHDGTAKLLDFGIAKLVGDAAPEPPTIARRAPPGSSTPELDVTAPGATPGPPGARAPRHPPPRLVTTSGASVSAGGLAAAGTPRYMAPELWQGHGASVRSDLYALGVLLHELIVGVPPFAQAELDTLREAIVDGPPPPRIDTVVADADVALSNLVADLLDRDPGRRPGSADAVVHRLERIVDGAAPIPDGSPYPGLAPFEASHRAVFFGRGSDVSAIVDRLRTSPVVAVIGDSGIGKSSVCRAGVVAAVERGALGDRRTWSVVHATIGRRPATALRDALGLAAGATPTVLELVAHLGAGAATGAGTLVFVDQLEELVTMADPDEACDAARLLAALADDAPGIKLLLAVRGDFVTRVAGWSALGPVMSRSLHLLRRLDAADARDAIVGPATAKGVAFENQQLVETLVDAVTANPGALPLLQFTLAALWQRRDVARDVIPAAALAAMGGVGGSLAQHGDGILSGLSAPARRSARRIMVSLVTPEQTRASREHGELVAADDAAAADALEALVRGRLIVARDTPAGEPSYALAHEALVASWQTLRDWLDAESGLRGLRARLAAAVDEWHRLGRSADLLWGAARLTEARGLGEVAARDAAFLVASRGAVRRRRLGRGLLVASVPAVAIASWLAFRASESAARDRQVRARLSAAAGWVATAERERRHGAAARATAFALFDGGDPAAGEARWRDAVQAIDAARAAYRDATAELEAAVVRGGQRADVRARMADAILDHALVAELAGDAIATAELVRRLAAYDDGSRRRRWDQPGALTVEAAGATRIHVHAYVDRRGVLEPGPALLEVAGPRLAGSLPPGSYVVQLEGGGGAAVALPVVIGRGEPVVAALTMPVALPDGFVYVPAGRFVVGGAGDDLLRRDFLSAPPRHAIASAAYLIARHEVTFAGWMEYLRVLTPDERERRRPATAPGRVMTMRLDGHAPYALTLQPSTVAYHAAEGQPLIFPGRTSRREVRWERLPVSGVSFEDARAYAAWLASTGRVPRARLCTEHEWERAARGADGRSYPHGERLDVDDANIDVTYGRDPMSYGPDEVGAHPRSRSPLGVDDLTGNAWEWVRGPGEAAMFRGGGWYHGVSSALTMNRDFADPTMRPVWAGVRICADP